MKSLSVFFHLSFQLQNVRRCHADSFGCNAFLCGRLLLIVSCIFLLLHQLFFQQFIFHLGLLKFLLQHLQLHLLLLVLVFQCFLLGGQVAVLPNLRKVYELDSAAHIEVDTVLAAAGDGNSFRNLDDDGVMAAHFLAEKIEQAFPGKVKLLSFQCLLLL